MEEDQHTLLAEKYGFDTGAYMKQAVDCAKSGGTAGEADLYVVSEHQTPRLQKLTHAIGKSYQTKTASRHVGILYQP
jgi:hypothetical protein